MTQREAFEAWWGEFSSAHEDWKYADSAALRWAAWQAAQAAQPAQVPAWRDISTALPETGIPVLADIGEKFPIRACWIAKFTQEIGGSDFEGDDDYDEATDTTYWPEGWYEWNRFDETHWLVDKPVKNWALLPAAPEVK